MKKNNELIRRTHLKSKTQRNQEFLTRKVPEAENQAENQARREAVNRSSSWSFEFELIVKYFWEDLLIPTTVVSKKICGNERKLVQQ